MYEFLLFLGNTGPDYREKNMIEPDKKGKFTQHKLSIKKNVTYSGSGKGLIILVCCMQLYPIFLHNRLFPGLELVSFQSCDNNFTAVAPKLHHNYFFFLHYFTFFLQIF